MSTATVLDPCDLELVTGGAFDWGRMGRAALGGCAVGGAMGAVVGGVTGAAAGGVGAVPGAVAGAAGGCVKGAIGGAATDVLRQYGWVP